MSELKDSSIVYLRKDEGVPYTVTVERARTLGCGACSSHGVNLLVYSLI